MNKEDSIRYRRELINRAYDSEKLTSEETFWLRNTPCYSEVLGSEYYRSDILQLKANTRYLIKMECIQLDPYVPIMPNIAVPTATKGGYLQFDTKYHKDVQVTNKKRKSMSLRIDQEHPAHIYFRSPTGNLQISYYSWVINKDKAWWWQSTFYPSLAMEKHIIAENKVMYGCAKANGTKENLVGTNWFDKFVFTVEWEEV